MTPYIFVLLAAVIYCSVHYVVSKIVRKVFDAEGEFRHWPMPLWVHCIMVFPTSAIVTAALFFLLYKSIV